MARFEAPLPSKQDAFDKVVEVLIWIVGLAALGDFGYALVEAFR